MASAVALCSGAAATTTRAARVVAKASGEASRTNLVQSDSPSRFSSLGRGKLVGSSRAARPAARGGRGRTRDRRNLVALAAISESKDGTGGEAALTVGRCKLDHGLQASFQSLIVKKITVLST